MLSFFAAKMNGYYATEGLDVDLLATRAPTANLAVLSGSVEFSAVPLAGLTTALRGAPLKLLFVPFDKPQHELFVKPELQGIKALRGKENRRCWDRHHRRSHVTRVPDGQRAGCRP